MESISKGKVMRYTWSVNLWSARMVEYWSTECRNARMIPHRNLSFFLCSMLVKRWISIFFEKKLVSINYKVGDTGQMVCVLNLRSRGLGFRPCWVIMFVLRSNPFTFTVPLSAQESKWVSGNCQGVTLHGLASHPGGSSDTPSGFMLRKLE